jgi:hypothetical protein
VQRATHKLMVVHFLPWCQWTVDLIREAYSRGAHEEGVHVLDIHRTRA